LTERRTAQSWPFVPIEVCSLLVAGLALNSLASPVQHPKRSINSYTVDLGPLFKWWNKHDGARPLSAWVHITGSISGTNGGAWIIEGRVEGASHRPEDESNGANGSVHNPGTIILQNPPVDDLVEFEQLSGRLNTLLAQRSHLAGEESDARMREQAVAGQQRANRRYPAQARVLALEDKQLKQTETTVQAGEKALDQEIKDLKAKLAIYPSTDHFEVDCFALDLHYDYQRVPVYDHGRIPK
jgi:hypothetical protein